MTAATLLDALRRSSGPPDCVRGDSEERGAAQGNHGNLSIYWQVLPGMQVSMASYAYPETDSDLPLTVTRSRGGAAGVPSEADGQAWLNGYLDLVTGLAFLVGHGAADAALLRAARALMPDGGKECPRYVSSLFGPVPSLSQVMMDGDTPPSGPSTASCAAMPFREVSASIWAFPGVTTTRAITRLTARFGAPKVQPPDDEQVRLSWTGPNGLAVNLTDRFAGQLRRTFDVTASR